jgi:hypothetical protein
MGDQDNVRTAEVGVVDDMECVRCIDQLNSSLIVAHFMEGSEDHIECIS